MESGNPIVQGDRLANQVYCLLAVAELVGDDAEKMEAIGVILIDREDFPVVALSFTKLAGLMMPQRRGQQLGNLMRGVNGRAGRRSNGDLLALFRRHPSLFSVHNVRCTRSRLSQMTTGLARMIALFPQTAS